MGDKRDTSDHVEHPKERTREAEPLAAERAEAWSARSSDPKVNKLEQSMDEQIAKSGASKSDQDIMKGVSHALAEGNLDQLKKLVEGKDPETMARIAKELDESFRKAGLKTTVSFNKEGGGVLEFDDQTANRRLMIPHEKGHPAMGNNDGVHYDDYDKTRDGRIADKMQRSQLEGNADDVAKQIAKDLAKRNAARPEPKVLSFD